MAKRADGQPKGAPRYFVCGVCRRRKRARAVGRLPKRCGQCVPRKVATQRDRVVGLQVEVDRLRRRVEKKARRIHSLEQQRYQLRRDLAAARGRVAVLEHERDGAQDLRRRLGEFDVLVGEAARSMQAERADVGRAVRRLAAATGRRATFDALVALGGACRSWAMRLAEAEGERSIAVALDRAAA